jgi:hypothetical protein
MTTLSSLMPLSESKLVVQGGFLKVLPQSLKISSQHGWRLEQGTPKL